MRILIKRLFSYQRLAPAAVLILVLLSGSAAARSPIPATSDDRGVPVYSDPGEDPHLRAVPVISPLESRGLDEGISLSTTGRSDPVIVGGPQDAGSSTGAGQFRVKNKLLVTLQILFGPLLR